ncbi:MAG TPA: cupin [Solirubrobacterales bacterium]|nr:cupin [Solirubrobacterales bacterium]
MHGSEQSRVEKPWGHEIWWAQTDDYAGKILVVNAGQRLSLQQHLKKDESSYLLSGQLRLTQGKSQAELTDREIGPGESWRIEPGVIHSIEALVDSVVLEVSTPQLDDVIRLDDRYGRASAPPPSGDPIDEAAVDDPALQ